MLGQGFRVTPDLTLGLAYAHLQTTTQGSQQQVTGATNGFSGYGSYLLGPWQFSGLAGGGVTSLSTSRQLNPLGMSASGSQNEDYYDGTLQVRYLATIGAGYLMPFARIGFIDTSRGAFAEGGAGNLDISYSNHSGSLTAFTGGVRAGYSTQRDGYDIHPWVELSGTGFAGDLNISDIETIGLTSANETSQAAPSALANVGAGVTFNRNAWSGSLSYQGQVAGSSQANTFSAMVTYRW
jgi:hypothetical protein